MDGGGGDDANDAVSTRAITPPTFLVMGVIAAVVLHWPGRALTKEFESSSTLIL
jgi:hypothetical protein